jgi:hypothetical protein
MNFPPLSLVFRKLISKEEMVEADRVTIRESLRIYLHHWFKNDSPKKITRVMAAIGFVFDNLVTLAAEPDGPVPNFTERVRTLSTGPLAPISHFFIASRTTMTIVREDAKRLLVIERTPSGEHSVYDPSTNQISNRRFTVATARASAGPGDAGATVPTGTVQTIERVLRDWIPLMSQLTVVVIDTSSTMIVQSQRLRQRKSTVAKALLAEFADEANRPRPPGLFGLTFYDGHSVAPIQYGINLLRETPG